MRSLNGAFERPGQPEQNGGPETGICNSESERPGRFQEQPENPAWTRTESYSDSDRSSHEGPQWTIDRPEAMRELTDEEKSVLKEELGWTEGRQIAKCSMKEDGTIHFRTDCADREGKSSVRGVLYERKTVSLEGKSHEVTIKVEGVFPVFNSVYDVKLPKELEQSSNARQFKECNCRLKEAVADDTHLRKTFSKDQLADISEGRTPSGYVWHHNEEQGKMQLVKIEDHDRTQGGAAHTGGKSLWGGGYGKHE